MQEKSKGEWNFWKEKLIKFEEIKQHYFPAKGILRFKNVIVLHFSDTSGTNIDRKALCARLVRIIKPTPVWKSEVSMTKYGTITLGMKTVKLSMNM